MTTSVVARTGRTLAWLLMATLALATSRSVAQTEATNNDLRIVQISEDELYVIAPAPEGRALAYRWVIGNKGEVDTPPQSIGGSYGGWRIRSVYGLPSLTSDPTGPRIVFTEDIGSSDYAFLLNQPTGTDLYGGVFHGFGQAWTSETFSVTASTQFADAFAATHIAKIVWPNEQGSMDVAYASQIDAEGVLTSQATFESQEPFTSVFPDMIIGSGQFTQMRSGDETGWTDIEAPGHYKPTDPDDITIRNPDTGAQIRRVHANATSDTFVRRDNRRTKIYTRIATGTGSPMGVVTSSRTVYFEMTKPDEVEVDWAGAEDGIGEWSITHGNPAFVSGGLQFVLDKDKTQRAHLFLGVLEPGNYTLPIEFSFDTPALVTWGSAYISSNVQGSTANPIKQERLKNFVGPLTFTIPPGNIEPNYLRIALGPLNEANGEVLRVTRVGPLTKLP